MQEYESQMDEYKKTDNWRKYQVYLNDFKSQQSQPTSGKRSNMSRTLSHSTREHSRASPEGPESPNSSVPSSTSSTIGTDAEVCHNALTLAFSELVSLRGEILNQATRPYDENHLPSEELVRRSMYAFVRGTGSLLFMWSYHQADEILDRIYRPKKPIDAMDLAECFTVAAMGAHYDMECFPDRIRRVLYASGTLHFHEKTARNDYMRTMRLLLSMSFYALLEKHMSARYLIGESWIILCVTHNANYSAAAGLQIARWKCPALNRTPTSVMDENWRKIFRSLIFMDSWLAYTLGYNTEATPNDIQVRVGPNNDHSVVDQKQIACLPRHLPSETIDEMIHTQTSKIGLIAAEIAKTLASPELATHENVAMLTQKLETWRIEVPLMLQLPTLTSATPPDLSLYQRRAILMVHVSLAIHNSAVEAINVYTRSCTLVPSYLFTASCSSQPQKGSSQMVPRIASALLIMKHECTGTNALWQDRQ